MAHALTRRQRAARRRQAPRTAIRFTQQPPCTDVEVFRGKDGRWRFHAKARNHAIIASGDGYTRKWSAARGALRVFPGANLHFLTAAAA